MLGLKKQVKNFLRKSQIITGFPAGNFVANTESFNNLFPKNAKVKCIATGFNFTEGPVWLEDENCLLFSDIPANKIFKLKSDLKIEVFRSPSGNSNGLTLDKQGRLIACEHGNRKVTRTEKDGSITVLADNFQNKKLNSPNDVIVNSDGSIYFTDPLYGIKPNQQERPVQGVYRISEDGKEIKLIAKDFTGPNGLAFTPDEKKIYIDDSSHLRHIRVFDVGEDGSLSNGKIFYDMNVEGSGRPDGMKVDSDGNIFCTGPGGIWVFDPEGIHLGTIILPEQPSNCSWGDNDWKSLYITAKSSVYRIRVNNPGVKL